MTLLLILLIAISAFAGCGNSDPQAKLSALESSEAEELLHEEEEEEEQPIVETAQAEPVSGAEATPFAIYRESDGTIVKLGDKREDVEKIFGDVRMVMEFEADSIERHDYWDFPGVFIDYDQEGVVRAIRIGVEASDWKIFNGVKPGNPIAKVRSNYQEEYIHKYPDVNDLIMIAYDENGNYDEFSETAKYFVRYNIKEDKVGLIVIQDNTIGPESRQLAGAGQ